MKIDEILDKQRKFFASGKTLDIKFRIKMLKRLYDTVLKHEAEITESLYADLEKSDFEGYMCEIGMTLAELSFLIKKTPKLAKDKKVKTPIAQYASKSCIKSVPYGNTLIMSPWNYPLLLTLEPLADAIAAGNTAVVKPSAYSPRTADTVRKIISECFDPEYVVVVVTGGRKENAELLKKKFDFVFFTGSQSVGREVLRQTAEHLTPAVLELGGKSPCIVDETAKIELAARRIVFGKYLNCGQTCVAPDHILCHRSVKDKFVRCVCDEIKRQFGAEPLENPDYGKVINEKHFDRICELIDENKTVFGGRSDRRTLKIEPTVMDGVIYGDAVMQEEIFGPIMPILTYDSIDELIDSFYGMPKPLALYIFSENKANINAVTERVRYGGGCVNDVIIHLATGEMPFGGVGESGMGSYHGSYGFDTFSHKKSILNKKTWIDLPMRYQPYDRKKYGKIVRSSMK